MTIRTQQDLLTNVFQDGQPANSITASDMRDLVESTPYLGGQGWQFYYDDQYTQGAPRHITAGSHAQITINGGQETLGHPPGMPAFWNTTTNKLIPSGLNNFGIVRLAFAGYYTGGGSQSLFDVHLDVGGTTGIIWEETGIFLKGPSGTQFFNFTIPLFSGPDFQANGGELHFIPQHDCYMWQFALTTVQIYAANPAL